MVQLPGRVLEETIYYGRNYGGEGSFLQCCNQMDVVQEPGGRHEILQIRGQPFDPNRMYNVATLHHLLNALDDIQPLIKYAKENDSRMPHLDATQLAKELVLQVYSKDIWTSLGIFDEIDTNRTDTITEQQLGAALAKKIGIDPHDIWLVIR
jgi:hypothetical protein